MIEDILKKLTEAIEANTEVQTKILEKLNSVPAAKAEEKPKTTRRTRKSSKSKAEEPKAEKAEEPKVEKSDGPKVTQDVLLKEFKAFLKKATDAGRKDEALKLVKDLAQEYGADKVTGTKSEDWPDMLKDLSERSEAFFAASDDGEEDIL